MGRDLDFKEHVQLLEQPPPHLGRCSQQVCPRVKAVGQTPPPAAPRLRLKAGKDRGCLFMFPSGNQDATLTRSAEQLADPRSIVRADLFPPTLPRCTGLESHGPTFKILSKLDKGL